MSLLHRTRSIAPADEPTLTADQLAELDALDAALSGEAVTDEALAALVRDVRAAAPEMRPEATQQLNERVHAGFGMPTGRDASPARRWFGARPAPAIAAGLALTVLAVATGVTVLGGSQTPLSSEITLQRGAGSSAAPDIATSDSAASTASSGPTPASASGVPAPATGAPEFRNEFEKQAAAPAAETGSASDSAAQVQKLLPLTSSESDRSTARAVERSVDLAVRVKSDELPKASAEVQRITRGANGYVATSDVSLGREGQGGIARFQLRVDSSKLDRAIDRLAGLGTVLSQNESSRDITSALDGARSRLDDATQERKALLAALGKATTSGEIAALRTRIAENRRLRARLDADLQRVQRRADLTTIELTLSAPSKGDPTADDGSWTLGDAAGDAWSALRAILGALLVAAAIAAPFALIGGAGWALWARRQRAARERTLDA